MTVSDFSALSFDENTIKSEEALDEDIETETVIDYVTLDDCLNKNKVEHSRLHRLKSADFDTWSYTNTTTSTCEDDFIDDLFFDQEQTVVGRNIPSSPTANKVSRQ